MPLRTYTLALVTALLLVAGTSAQQWDERQVPGKFRMTATDKDFVCGGGQETETEEGELAPVNLHIPPERRIDVRLQAGGMRRENQQGFATLSVDIDLLWFFAHDRREAGFPLSGGGAFGWWDKAVERRSVVGIATGSVTERKGLYKPLGCDRVFEIKGTYSGDLVDAGSVDAMSDTHGGTGEKLGKVNGEFTTMVYVYLPDVELDRSYYWTVVEGRVYKEEAGRWCGVGDRVYPGETMCVPKDAPGGTMLVSSGEGSRLWLDPNTYCRAQRVIVHRKKIDYIGSTIRVFKGILKAIIEPLRGEKKNVSFYSNCGGGGVHGTVLQLEVDEERDRFALLEGSLEVYHNSDPDSTVLIGPGECVEMDDEGMVRSVLPEADRERMLEEIRRRTDVPLPDMETEGGTWDFDVAECWRPEDGSLVMHGTDEHAKRRAMYSRVLGDASLSVEVRKVAGEGDDVVYAYGVLVRSDEEGANCYELGITTTGMWRVSRRADGELQPLTEWQESGALKEGLGQWNTLRVVSRDGRLVFSANGEQLHRLMADEPGDLERGRVGVFAVDGEGEDRERVEFRDFDLRTPKNR